MGGVRALVETANHLVDLADEVTDEFYRMVGEEEHSRLSHGIAFDGLSPEKTFDQVSERVGSFEESDLVTAIDKLARQSPENREEARALGRYSAHLLELYFDREGHSRFAVDLKCKRFDYLFAKARRIGALHLQNVRGRAIAEGLASGEGGRAEYVSLHDVAGQRIGDKMGADGGYVGTLVMSGIDSPLGPGILRDGEVDRAVLFDIASPTSEPSRILECDAGTVVVAETNEPRGGWFSGGNVDCLLVPRKRLIRYADLSVAEEMRPLTHEETVVVERLVSADRTDCEMVEALLKKLEALVDDP